MPMSMSIAVPMAVGTMAVRWPVPVVHRVLHRSVPVWIMVWGHQTGVPRIGVPVLPTDVPSVVRALWRCLGVGMHGAMG